MQRTILMLLIAIVCLLHACAPKYIRYVSHYSFKSNTATPDYTNLNYWAAHPDKKDPSDSIPPPLVTSTVKDTVADVFFLHPTTLTSLSDTAWNADINDSI